MFLFISMNTKKSETVAYISGGKTSVWFVSAMKCLNDKSYLIYSYQSSECEVYQFFLVISARFTYWNCGKHLLFREG